MIKKWVSRVFKRKQQDQAFKLQVIRQSVHGLDANALHTGAVRVVQTLQQAGYQAYVVGGAVRDLLLGIQPKDFDVATNAEPEQVQALFRRSRIIGRRFRLVHVYAGADIIEVSTFRGGAEGVTNETGRIIQDNAFGSIDQDAQRRDFTVNALYYDTVKQEILDYHGGFTDLAQKRMVLIGDAAVRYPEDPVRMLRAVRLAAKLGLVLDSTSFADIHAHAEGLTHVPESRLFDELLKFLLSGHAKISVQALQEARLHAYLLPILDEIAESPLSLAFLNAALQNTDTRVRAGKPVSPGFTLAALLWHAVREKWYALEAQGNLRTMPALFTAIDDALAAQDRTLSIPKRYTAQMNEIWAMQPRFSGRAGQKPFRLLEHPRFRAAYDFLCLRAQVGEVSQELADWWTVFQTADMPTREAMLVKETAPSAGRKRRRRPAKKNPNKSSEGA